MEPQTGEELKAMTGQAVMRELTNKKTGEVLPVLSTSFGNEEVIFTTEVGDVTFSNIGSQGNLLNDEYTVAEVDNTETEVEPA